jgi:hypothetical protein
MPKDKTKAEAAAARTDEVERQLDITTASIDFADVPLRDVLEYLGDIIKVDLLPARSEQIDLDAPINLRLKHKPVSIRTALELVLEQLGTPTTFSWLVK